MVFFSRLAEIIFFCICEMTLLLCRVCLSGDIKMVRIKNNELLQIYEKLANGKFQMNEEDERPRTVCYICYSQLQKCHIFSETAQKSEKHLRDLMLNGTKITLQMVSDLKLATKPSLSITAPEKISLHESEDSGRLWSFTATHRHRDVKEENVTVKEENAAKDEVLVEVERIDEMSDDRLSVDQPEANHTNNTNTNLSIDHDDQDKQFSCKECGKRFAMMRYLKQHMVVHSEERPFYCIFPPCSKTFSRKSDLNRHVKNHPEFKPDKIVKPPKVEKVEAQVEKPFACTKCDKRFILQRYLQQHLLAHSRNKPLLKCATCGKVFSRKFLLERHAASHSKPAPRRRRPDDRPYHCHVCGKQFKMNNHLTSHMRRHTGERPYSCHLCGKTFRYECNLRIHVKVHSGQKPFACHVCRKPFMLKGNLKQHMQTHTGERPFPCSLCDKRFTQKCSLKLHMQFHSGEKTFACSLCDKRFFRVCYLKRHMLGHSGSRPFACDRCDKDYTDPSTLRVHQRLHTGERPYACHACGATFTRSHHLKQHTSSSKCNGLAS